MDEELKNIELIEQYCEGKMSAEEILAFENSLLVDDELKEEFELYKKIIKSLNEIKEDSIKAKLNTIDTELDNSKTEEERFVLKMISKKHYAIAASIVILIGMTSYFLFFSNSKEKLITSYEIEEPGLPVLMGNSSTVSFDNAMSEYKLNHLEESLDALKKLQNKSSNNDTLNYFIGIILSKQNKSKEAVPYLEKVAQNKDSSFKQKSMYQLGICYWRNNNIENAKALFTQLTIENNDQLSEKAKEILKHL